MCVVIKLFFNRFLIFSFFQTLRGVKFQILAIFDDFRRFYHKSKNRIIGRRFAKTEIYKIASVRASVRPSVRACVGHGISQKPLQRFSRNLA